MNLLPSKQTTLELINPSPTKLSRSHSPIISKKKNPHLFKKEAIINDSSFETYFNNIMLKYYKLIFHVVGDVTIDFIIKSCIPKLLKDKCDNENIIYIDNFNRYNNVYPLPNSMLNVPIEYVIDGDNISCSTNYYFNASKIKDHNNIMDYLITLFNNFLPI